MDVRARGLFVDDTAAIQTAAQMEGKSAVIIKASHESLGSFGAKVQATANAGLACGMFWEADLWFYPDQGFSPSDKTRWTPPANDAQFQLMDRFVNNHAVQFAMVDLTVTARAGRHLDAVWLEASGQHILDTMAKRYPKLKQIYLYINKSTVDEYSGGDKSRIGAFIINNKIRFPLAFADNETNALTGGRPKMAWDDGNMWHWWLSFIPKFEFIFAWDRTSLFKNIGFTGATTPTVPVDDPVTDPIIPGGDLTSINAKLDAIIAKLNQHFK